jgi:hypothetical protein
MDYIKAPVQWTFLLLSNIVLDLIGLVAVPIGMLFLVDGKSLSDGRDIRNLPKWLHIFGNDYDGSLGDKRDWWNDNCDYLVMFGLFPILRKYIKSLPVLTKYSWLSQYWWMALRNPANNMRTYSLWQATLAGATITYKGNYIVEDRPGMGGWQFVTTELDGKKWYGFYLVHEWNTKAALVVRLGFKVKPSHKGSTEEPKGMTTKINLYKAI